MVEAKQYGERVNIVSTSESKRSGDLLRSSKRRAGSFATKSGLLAVRSITPKAGIS
jgi:hypothetical protein